MDVDNDDGKPGPAADDSGSGGGEGTDAQHSRTNKNGDGQDLTPNPQQHHQLKHPPPSSTTTTTTTTTNRPTSTNIVNPYAKTNSNKTPYTTRLPSLQQHVAASASSSLKSSSNVDVVEQRRIQQRTPPINPYAKVNNKTNNSHNNQPSTLSSSSTSFRTNFYESSLSIDGNDHQKPSNGVVDGPSKTPPADDRCDRGGSIAGSAVVSSSATAITTMTTQQQTWRPYWDRLPSKNLQNPCPSVTETTADDTSSAPPATTTTSVPNQDTQAPTGSLGPAEVLMVAECVEHAELYKNRPVRVTGVLHHRSFLAVGAGSGEDNTTASSSRENDLPGGGGNHLSRKDLIVQLELKDPVMELSALNINSSSRSSGFAHRKASSSRPSNIPAASRRRNSVPTSSTIRTSGGLPTTSIQKTRKRRMPWFQNPSKDGRRRTSLGTGGGGNIGRNSLLSTNTTTIRSSNGSTGKNTTKNTTKKNIVLKVLVDPQLPQLDSVVVGSVVMVIGTIKEIRSSSQQERNNETSIEKGETCTVDYKEDEEINKVDPTSPKRLDGKNQEGEETAKDLTSQVTPSQNRYVYKLDSRLVQVMPKGSDLTLYRIALERRRKTLWKRYHMPQNLTDKVQDRTSKVLLQGCGPPPYDRWVDKV